MIDYEAELERLRPGDGINGTSYIGNYQFIDTYGHGYLVVPKDDWLFDYAKGICTYGYITKNAVYLEEDCEMQKFLEKITFNGTLKEYTERS